MGLEPILESTECWRRSNVGRQTVPHRRTSDGECPVAKTKSGARDDEEVSGQMTSLFKCVVKECCTKLNSAEEFVSVKSSKSELNAF